MNEKLLDAICKDTSHYESVLPSTLKWNVKYFYIKDLFGCIQQINALVMEETEIQIINEFIDLAHHKSPNCSQRDYDKTNTNERNIKLKYNDSHYGKTIAAFLEKRESFLKKREYNADVIRLINKILESDSVLQKCHEVYRSKMKEINAHKSKFFVEQFGDMIDASSNETVTPTPKRLQLYQMCLTFENDSHEGKHYEEQFKNPSYYERFLDHEVSQPTTSQGVLSNSDRIIHFYTTYHQDTTNVPNSINQYEKKYWQTAFTNIGQT